MGGHRPLERLCRESEATRERAGEGFHRHAVTVVYVPNLGV